MTRIARIISFIQFHVPLVPFVPIVPFVVKTKKPVKFVVDKKTALHPRGPRAATTF